MSKWSKKIRETKTQREFVAVLDQYLAHRRAVSPSYAAVAKTFASPKRRIRK